VKRLDVQSGTSEPEEVGATQSVTLLRNRLRERKRCLAADNIGGQTFKSKPDSVPMNSWVLSRFVAMYLKDGVT
jgi:hypothetical protein